MNEKPDPATWAATYSSAVVGWLRPFAGVYKSRGHDLEDLAQEARLVLLESEDYLTDYSAKITGDSFRGFVRTLVLRAVRRRLLGRAKRTPEFASLGEMEQSVKDESSEHSVHLQLELAEMVSHAPPFVRMYLQTLLGHPNGAILRTDPGNGDTQSLRKQSAEYVLAWIEKHHWRHES